MEETEFMESIAKLINDLMETNRIEDAENVFLMTAYVQQMEEKMDKAILLIKDLQEQIQQLNQEQRQGNETLEEYLAGVSNRFLHQSDGMKEELMGIKLQMTQKATDIVVAVKKKGVEELNRISEFFDLKEKLTKLCKRAESALFEVNETIKKIDDFGIRMRDAGKEAANAVRTLIGKEEKCGQDKAFFKTDFLKKPFLIQKKLLGQILKVAKKALEKCDNLSVAAKKDMILNAREQNLLPDPIAPIKRARSR